MAINASLTAIEYVSETVYMGLCRYVGTSDLVAMRRDAIDITEEVFDRLRKKDESCLMKSGSEREAFRLEGSDVDYMIWPNNHRVIWDWPQSNNYSTSTFKLIMCDNSRSPPGYSLLYLLAPNADKNVLSACVKLNGKQYISSSVYRNIIMCQIWYPERIPHGPCVSLTTRTLEYDCAYCFTSDFWPPSAFSFIDRYKSWPQSNVVQAMLKRGCHFVAIGHKKGNYENEEWRISFSAAEQMLVYSMNHCQFLLYGLLKIFLKEVINAAAVEKMLCSYHIKTAVFWMLQQNTIFSWCPKNLLKSFWICFTLILKWVYEGNCPNFFIPENNMFKTSIFDSIQSELFSRLYALYEKGLLCLLESTSIGRYIMHYATYNPTLSIFRNENFVMSESEVDIELLFEMHVNELETPCDTSLSHCIASLSSVEQLITSPISQYKVHTLQNITRKVLQNTVFLMHNINKNKIRYIADKMSCHMLKLAAKFGCISDMLCIAIYYYKTFRFHEALRVIESTKVRLAQPYVLNLDTGDHEEYLLAVGGHSWSRKLRNAMAIYVSLNTEASFFDDILPGQQNNYTETTHIPPLVLLHFLEFLCWRHFDPIKAKSSMHDLQVVVQQELLAQEISWGILGRCQMLSGDSKAALYSLEQSLLYSDG